MPRIIQGQNIRLEPLSNEHFTGLCDCLLGESNGWYSLQYGLNSAQGLRLAIDNRLRTAKERTALSFVIVDLKTSKIAGLSHLMRIDVMNRQLEIGGTQVGRHFRQSHVNTEVKLLMLSEAFETLKVIRVYLKVDVENLISQRAVLRVGAKLEGTFRNDWILPDGRKRDCHVYSIIDSEWPLVKGQLVKLLSRA